MEHTQASFVSLLVVVIAAFLTPILLNRMRLRFIPVVVGEIIAGLIIGKTGFDLVEKDVWIQTLSTLGFIYLLFLSGVEIDFSVFANKRNKDRSSETRAPNGLVVAAIIFVLMILVSFLLSLLFVSIGLIDNVYLMTLIIATISLGIVVPTIKDMGIVKTGIGQLILLITVLGDLMTMILLAVFVSFFSAKSGETWFLLILFAAGVLLYFIGKYFRHQSFLETMTKGTIHLDTRAVFALIIVLVALSNSLGVEIILGSFLAGALVSLLSPNPAMVQRLDSFGYGFLIPIFFVMVGVKLDLWSLFSSDKVLLLMPMLLVAFFAAKILPALILKKWYGWKTAYSIGFLVAAKLTLVIAAVRVGQDLKIVSNDLASAVILVAVISCIIGPIVFKKLFPESEIMPKKTKVVFIGANPVTLPLTLELDNDHFDTTVYHCRKDQWSGARNGESSFTIQELPSYDPDALEQAGAFDADIFVASTNNDANNTLMAERAKELVAGRVIARVESTELSGTLRNQGIEVFSSLFSTKAILKAMVESPSVVEILTTKENGLYQIEMNNHDYAGTKLREFPYMGDTIIVRIFRDNNSIVPHGDTSFEMGDRLIVSGSKIHVDQLQELLA
ncbi:MAG TPA: monovalent cation:proton antiporter family protein [Bacillales bacterium]|nr:monovalent cation:proton antiporter family protein [Bacillales bacterium]